MHGSNREREMLVFEDTETLRPDIPGSLGQEMLQPEADRVAFTGLGTETISFVGQTGLKDALARLPEDKAEDQLDLTPNPNLSERYQSYELILLVLLKKSNCQKGDIVKLLGLSTSYCSESLYGLQKARLVELVSEYTKTYSDTPVNLHHRRIIGKSRQPYVTRRVLEALAQKDDSSQVQDLLRSRIKSEERRAKKPTGDAIFAGLKPAIKQPEAGLILPDEVKSLHFKIIVEDSIFLATYDPRKFAELDPRVKVILGAWLANGFARDAAQFDNTVATIANKKVTEDTKLSHSEIHDILQDLTANGYCQNGSWRYSVTRKGVELLKAYRANRNKGSKREQVETFDL